MTHLIIRRRASGARHGDTPPAAPAVSSAPRPPEGFTDTPVPLDGGPAEGNTLARVIYLSGLASPPALCSGLGRCGRCRVRFLSGPPPVLPAEREILSPHDIEDNWRLACRHAPAPGMHVLLPDPSPCAGGEPGQQDAAAKGRPSFREKTASALLLAVDLGTTSLHWRAVRPGADERDGPGNSPAAQGVMINPQMGAGSDVMSRLAYAADDAGAATLRRLTLDALAGIRAGLDAPVAAICLAANPAMTAITLGKNSAGLRAAPYRLDYAGGGTERIPGLPPVWVPPLLSPFVGGDASAGYAALMFDPRNAPPAFPFLLADLGTNGELVLALSATEALAASVPMGPALEGINLTFGTEARFGAVTAYTLTPLGLEPAVLGRTAPRGITATGYLSLLQQLRKAGLVGADGLFTARPGGLGHRLGTAEGQRLRLPGRMFLAASDVEEILKVKAAFSLAFSRLLAAAGLAASRLAGLHVAGSLGTHAPAAALEELGFIPPGFAGRVHAAGNTSLAGAALFLLRPDARERSLAWAAGVNTLDLANDPKFTGAYADHMRFAWL